MLVKEERLIPCCATCFDLWLTISETAIEGTTLEEAQQCAWCNKPTHIGIVVKKTLKERLKEAVEKQLAELEKRLEGTDKGKTNLYVWINVDYAYDGEDPEHIPQAMIKIPVKAPFLGEKM